MSQDLSGIPDVPGLADFVQGNLQDKSAPAPEKVQETQQQAPVTEELDLGQFKTPKDMLKSYKEIQGYTTRVSQENKTLKQQQEQKDMEIAKLKEAIEMAQLQYQQPSYQQPGPQQPQKTFDDMFIQNPEQAIDYKAINAARKEIETARIADLLEEERVKNPEEFMERYAYAQQMAKYYPQLSMSKTGVSKLFQMADRQRDEDVKRNAHRALKKLFGDDVDLERFKAVLKADGHEPPKSVDKSLAYMPDTTMSTRSGSESGVGKSVEWHIQNAADKGDVDQVLQNVFKKALEK